MYSERCDKRRKKSRNGAFVEFRASRFLCSRPFIVSSSSAGSSGQINRPTKLPIHRLFRRKETIKPAQRTKNISSTTPTTIVEEVCKRPDKFSDGCTMPPDILYRRHSSSRRSPLRESLSSALHVYPSPSALGPTSTTHILGIRLCTIVLSILLITEDEPRLRFLPLNRGASGVHRRGRPLGSGRTRGIHRCCRPGALCR